MVDPKKEQSDDTDVIPVQPPVDLTTPEPIVGHEPVADPETPDEDESEEESDETEEEGEGEENENEG